jgi:hypothetical protein
VENYLQGGRGSDLENSGRSTTGCDGKGGGDGGRPTERELREKKERVEREREEEEAHAGLSYHQSCQPVWHD